MSQFNIKMLNSFTYVILITSMFLAWSIFDSMFRPAEYKDIRMIVEIDHTGKSRIPEYRLWKSKQIPVAYPGDVIIVEREIQRYRAGEVTTEKFVRDSLGIEYLDTTLAKSVVSNDLTSTRVQVKYEIPLMATTGCGAAVYSRSAYDYNWNLLTKIFPRILLTEKSYFCIESPAPGAVSNLHQNYTIVKK